MKWRVKKAGTGQRTFERVELHNSGALRCFKGDKLVCIYGPGMWVSAEESYT